MWVAVVREANHGCPASGTSYAFRMQHCLNLRPLPQGHGSFRPTRSPARVTVEEVTVSGSESRKLRRIRFFNLITFPRIFCPVRGSASDKRET